LGHPYKFQRVLRLGSVTARHLVDWRQPNFAALNRGRHLCSTGRPSGWALAHILVLNIVHIYRVSIRVRVRVRLKVSITGQNTIIMVAFYIMLARPVGRFFIVLRMNFPVMLIAEDICGRQLGLCR